MADPLVWLLQAAGAEAEHKESREIGLAFNSKNTQSMNVQGLLSENRI